MNQTTLIITIVISAAFGLPIFGFTCRWLCCTNRTGNLRTIYRRKRARWNQASRQANHMLARRELQDYRAQMEEARARGETVPENPELEEKAREEKARRASKELRDWAEIRALPVGELVEGPLGDRPIDRLIELMEL